MPRKVLLALLALALAGCGVGEAKEYGAAEAGPTKRATPLVADQPPAPAGPAEPVPPAAETSAELCELYTPEEIGEWLGLPVHDGEPVDGALPTCVWKGTGEPTRTKGSPPVPIVVSITRGLADDYEAYEDEIVELAESRSAGGAQVVRGVGDEAYAIGASVKGVPIWYGGTRHDDWMTAVEMSGGGSKAGVASVTELLLDILERG